MVLKNILGVVLVSVFVFASSAQAGKVELSTYYPAPYGEYSSLNATSSFIPPRMTTDQRDAISTATNPPLAQGMVIFNTDTNQLEVNRSTTAVADWISAGGNSSSLHYTNWGDASTASCASGFDTLYTGYMYQGGQYSGYGSGFVCSTGRVLKIYEINAAGTNWEWVTARRCAECAEPGARYCYTKWGDTTCADGFQTVYTGHMYQGGQAGGQGSELVCSAGEEKKICEWDYFTGLYSWWDPRPCAMCCRN